MRDLRGIPVADAKCVVSVFRSLWERTRLPILESRIAHHGTRIPYLASRLPGSSKKLCNWPNYSCPEITAAFQPCHAVAPRLRDEGGSLIVPPSSSGLEYLTFEEFPA